jgi:hypothetical protein
MAEKVPAKTMAWSELSMQKQIRACDIKAEAHPAELLLDKSGKTLYMFVSSVSKVQVVDTKKREVVCAWTTSSQRNGDGAFDERNHRLFIGPRTPPKMIVTG